MVKRWSACSIVIHRAGLAAVAAALVGSGGGGCARDDGPKLTALGADQFRKDPALFVAPDAPAQPPVPIAAIPGVKRAEPEMMGGGLDRVSVIVGAPDLPKDRPGAPGALPVAGSTPVIADAMVGQINGKPVFASEFLDPLDGKMRADLKKYPKPDDWLREQSGAVFSRVIDRVRSELVLGEARARLTPEERVGLTNLLTRIQGVIAAQSGGSLEQARADIERKSGETSLDRYLADERDQILIQRTLQEAIQPKIRVPWSAVERYYRENIDKYQPKGEAVLRVVVIDAKDADGLSAAAAAAGQSDSDFALFAKTDRNLFLRDTAGERRFSLNKPSSEWALVASKEINAAASKLQPGQHVGPLDFGRAGAERKVWVRRDADILQPGRTLEEAQVDIVRELMGQKFQSETGSFYQTLLGDSSFTPVDLMSLELLALAAERHISAEWAARVREQKRPVRPAAAPATSTPPAPPPAIK